MEAILSSMKLGEREADKGFVIVKKSWPSV